MGTRWEPSRAARMTLRIHLGDFIQSGHAQSLLKVVERAFRLSVLLVQKIVKDVLVSLDEAL